MKIHSLLYLLFFISFTAYPRNNNYVFKVIPFGVKGGSDESNLSCYILAAEGTDDYVCLDAYPVSRETSRVKVFR